MPKPSAGRVCDLVICETLLYNISVNDFRQEIRPTYLHSGNLVPPSEGLVGQGGIRAVVRRVVRPGEHR